jgi:hypothetical protein
MHSGGVVRMIPADLRIASPEPAMPRNSRIMVRLQESIKREGKKMSKKIHIIILPAILVSILAIFSFFGCGGGGTAQNGTNTIPAEGITVGDLNQQQLAQILADSVANYDKLTTYKFDMTMDMLMDVTGGTQSGKVTMNTKTNGAAKVAANEMQMNTEMTISMEGAGEQDSSESISYEVYQMADWLYMKLSVPGVGEQWMKLPATDTAKETFNMNPIDQQLGPLDSPVKIEYLRSEVVDGIDCHVLAVTPDMQALAEWLTAQETGGEDTDWQDLVNYSDVFKEFSYVCYVTKETNYLKRLIVNMVMEYTAEEAGESPETFDKMTMNISMDMNMYDHNKPFSITLPDEAANATEVSEDIFTS